MKRELKAAVERMRKHYTATADETGKGEDVLRRFSKSPYYRDTDLWWEWDALGIAKDQSLIVEAYLSEHPGGECE